VSSILVPLGRVEMRKENYKQAEAYYDRALQIVKTKLGPEHPQTADIMYELGLLYFVRPEEISSDQENQNEWAKDKADEYFLKALQIKEASLSPTHPDVARILTRLGSLYIERVQLGVAEKYLERAYNIRKQKLGPFHSRTGQTLKHMMTLYQSQENFPKAIQAGLEAKLIFEKSGGDVDTIANICVRLAELYLLVEGYNSPMVKQYLSSALDLRLPKLGADHPKVKEIKSMITSLAAPPPVSAQKPTQSTTTTEKVEVKHAKDCVVDSARRALLEDIRNFSRKDKKTKVKKFKQRKNQFDSADWWKQNYSYNSTPQQLLQLEQLSQISQLQQLHQHHKE